MKFNVIKLHAAAWWVLFETTQFHYTFKFELIFGHLLIQRPCAIAQYFYGFAFSYMTLYEAMTQIKYIYIL